MCGISNHFDNFLLFQDPEDPAGSFCVRVGLFVCRFLDFIQLQKTSLVRWISMVPLMPDRRSTVKPPIRCILSGSLFRSPATPVLPADCQLFSMLHTFCEWIWESPSFAMVDVNREFPLPASPINDSVYTDTFDGILMNRKTMEQRYSFENGWIRAVTLGQLHKETQLFFCLFG